MVLDVYVPTALVIDFCHKNEYFVSVHQVWRNMLWLSIASSSPYKLSQMYVLHIFLSDE